MFGVFQAADKGSDGAALIASLTQAVEQEREARREAGSEMERLREEAKGTMLPARLLTAIVCLFEISNFSPSCPACHPSEKTPTPACIPAVG